MVWKANGVWVQNMTACNFLTAPGATGNEFWWNGGDDSGKIGGWGYIGSYLNATSTFYSGEDTAAQYGIFSSNWNGGTWDNTYASNFNDSGYYIGACQQVCNQTVTEAWAEFNALGYSGSNSGGSLVVKNSQFDNNEDGFDTNSQNGDNPPPQNGACPNNGVSPVTHTTFVLGVHEQLRARQQQPERPGRRLGRRGPGRDRDVDLGRSQRHDRRTTGSSNNKAWGVIFVPYPDSGPPCTGGTEHRRGMPVRPVGQRAAEQHVHRQRRLRQPDQRGLRDDELRAAVRPTASRATRTAPGHFTTTPSNAQSLYPTCDGRRCRRTRSRRPFTSEVLCDSQISIAGAPAPCAPTDHYPRETQVQMHPLPPASKLPTMPNPCRGVPRNPWCSGKRRVAPSR